MAASVRGVLIIPRVIPHCGTEGKASTASEWLLGICFWRESREHGGRLCDSLRAEVSQDHFVFSPPTRQ